MIFFLTCTLNNGGSLFVYQFILQSFDSFLIASLLIRQLLLSHFFGHLDSLHHLLFRLQVCLFNLCLQPETITIEIIPVKRWSLANGELVSSALFKSISLISSGPLTELSGLPAVRFWQIQSLCGHRPLESNMKPAFRTAPPLDG